MELLHRWTELEWSRETGSALEPNLGAAGPILGSAILVSLTVMGLCWKIHRTEGQKLPPDPSPHSPKARASHFSEHSGDADRPQWQVLWFTLPVCGREGDGEDDPRWSDPSFTSD